MKTIKENVNTKAFYHGLPLGQTTTDTSTVIHASQKPNNTFLLKAKLYLQ